MDVNQIPYRFTDRIALGDWQFAIQKLTDPAPQPGLAAPEGTRLVAIDLTVRNGALKAQTMRPDVFWLYDGAGKGSQPLPAAAPSSFNRPLPSDGTRTGRLVFAVPEGEGPAVLLFRGTETYGQKVLNGIVSLDPDWTPAEPDL